MEGLSFGEQVKIILSRKNMTIKELAERIQEQTGKAMSRQNLTQRLGRDNFQEKDMRMIAAILGCPFRLSIFPTDPAEDEKIMEYANRATAKKRRSRQKDDADDMYQQTLVFDEEPIEEEPVRESEGIPQAAAMEPEGVPQAAVMESEDVPQAAVMESEGMPQAAVMEDERDMTIGELYEIHEELKELEEDIRAGEAVEIIKDEPLDEAEAEVFDETVEAEAEKTAEDTAAAEPEPVSENVEYQETKPAPEKKERFHTGGIFLRRLRRGDSVEKKEEPRVSAVTSYNEPKVSEARSYEESKPVKKERAPITPDSEDFEPVLKHHDAEEDLTLGEMNPYTGREYQSNSVRMHPTRIGYVQVYDRSQHQWTDMTEWAFLGYQERKKALLGKDYEPPIYLD